MVWLPTSLEPEAELNWDIAWTAAITPIAHIAAPVGVAHIGFHIGHLGVLLPAISQPVGRRLGPFALACRVEGGRGGPGGGPPAGRRRGLAEMGGPAQGGLVEGVKDQAPYDVIFIGGAVEQVPESLLSQLAEGGRLVTCIKDGQSRAFLFLKEKGKVGKRPDFDADVPVLTGFRKAVGFVF